MDDKSTDFQPLHRTLTVGLQYSNDVGSTSFYDLFVKDFNGVWGVVAYVWVDHATRKIYVSDAADPGKFVATNGLASLAFDDSKPRIAGRSVASYVLPRAGRLLGLLLVA